MLAAVKGHIFHHRTKFHTNRSNRYGDIAIFVIFQDGGRRHFGFSKIRNFNYRSAVRGQYASLYQILWKSVKQLQRYSDLKVYSKWGPSAILDLAPIGTTHDDFLMVSIVVRNLVEIDAVVSIPWNFQYFARFGFKTPIHAPKIGVFGGSHPQNGEQCQRNPQKAHPCANPRRLSHQAWKSVGGSDL